MDQGSIVFPWYALKVRASGELKVRQALEGKDYTVFLPTYIEGRKYSDRIKNVEAALFPGYLFARLDVNNRLPILQTPGVETIVSFGGEFEPVKEEEVGAIQRVITAGTKAIPWPYLKEGDKVRVQFGSMAGVEGLLVKVKGKDRLVLSVHILQRSISVEIDRAWVRPIS
jgi:transcription antitermination factor NusG